MNDFNSATASDWYARAIGNPGCSRTFDHAGTRLHYLDRPGPTPDAPLLMFVHGYRAHARWWDFVAPQFCATHRVVIMDAAGMGDSGRRADCSPQTFVEDLKSFLDHLHQPPSAIIGHSWGGFCALRLCAEYPQTVPHLIVVDTFVNVPVDEPLPNPPPIGNLRVYASQQAAQQRFRLSPDQPIVNQRVTDYIARASMHEVEGGWAWKYDPNLPMLLPTDAEGRLFLPQVDCPVDFIFCEHSAIVSRARAEATVGQLRRSSRAMMLPDAYHHPMLDQPLALTRLLRECLNRIRTNS